MGRSLQLPESVKARHLTAKQANRPEPLRRSSVTQADGVKPFAYLPHNETVSEVTVKCCAAQNPVFCAHFHRPDGIPLDKAFQFVAVGV
jgi:hypothetical protein